MASNARAHRRRQAREQQRVVGAIITTTGEQHYVSGDEVLDINRSPFPPKIPGRHRWIATAVFALTEHEVGERAPLDTKHLQAVSLGCWDCEKPLGEISVGGRCDAPAYPDNPG